MSTAPTTTTTTIAPADKPLAYMPIGGKSTVELTVNIVRRFLCTPTKSGIQPNDVDVMKFMKLCQARELDPWTGDAFLIGYDGYNGGPPTFSLITAIQALLKRAEMNPDYDGIEAGVVVLRDGKVDMRQGDLLLDDEKLLGGWARVYRKSQRLPSFDSIKLSTFNSGFGRWKTDPAGMIVKCAMSSALRTAFPTQIGGLYTADEMSAISNDRSTGRLASSKMATITSLDALSDRLGDTAAAHQHGQQDDEADQSQGGDADQSEAAVDPKSAIQERFSQAVIQGHDAVAALYDELAGPEAETPGELREYVDQCHMIAKRRLDDRAKESGGKSSTKQKPLLDQ